MEEVARTADETGGDAASTSSSDITSPGSPTSPDPNEGIRSLRPVRSTRSLSVFDDGLSDSSDDESSVRRSVVARSKRDSSATTSEAPFDEMHRRHFVRREYDDNSDVPPAKRTAIDGVFGANSARSFDLNASTTPLDLSALAPMQHLLHGSQLTDARFTPQGWASPLYGFPYHSAFGTPAVPQFLPHQMSLAHEQAQQLANSNDLMASGYSSGSQWSDRSSTSRRSISSSSTSLAASTSTLTDPGSVRSHLQSPISPHPHHSMSAGLTSALHAMAVSGLQYQQEAHVSH